VKCCTNVSLCSVDRKQYFRCGCYCKRNIRSLLGVHAVCTLVKYWNSVAGFSLPDPPDDPAIIVADDGKSLTCIANGNPKPTFTWIFPLPDTASVATFKGATVKMINPLEPARSNDNYTCVASNGVLPDKSQSMTIGTAVAVHCKFMVRCYCENAQRFIMFTNFCQR